MEVLILVQHLEGISNFYFNLEGISIFIFLTNVIKMLIVILIIMVIIMITNHKILLNLVVNKNSK
jgi:hypothetical protein